MAIRLSPEDAERYTRLRRRMLVLAPWAFSAHEDDDVALDLGFVRKALAEPENAVYAVEHAGELIAAAGVIRGKRPKFGHRARIWGVFVEPDHRGRGHGRAVLAAAIELARTWRVDFVDLGVSAGAPDALRLYERLGFVAWGREPEATAYGGQRLDEIHMTLRL